MTRKFDSLCCISTELASILIIIIDFTVTATYTISAIKNIDDDIFKFREENETEFKVYYVVMTSYIFNTLTHLFTIVGMRTNIHLLLLPWLIFRAIALLILIPLSFVYLSFAIMVPSSNQLMSAIICLVILIVCSWMWSVILLLYQSIKAGRSKTLLVEDNRQPSYPDLPPPYSVVTKY